MINFNDTFYPTPKSLINKMLNKIDFKLINSVLEPSGGKGDLIEAIKDKIKYSRYSRTDINYDIDTIEIDENLQHILRGKGFRVVHNDFLTYSSYKRYDAIIMNPPFSNGEKHLLKALDMQELTGGQIVCLLNSETINNPYSNSRKDLVNRLEKYNAEIEYIDNAFMDAERKTPVTVALIRITIPKNDNNSVILDELKKQEQHREESAYNSNNIINADFIKGIVEQYNFEVKAGLKLIAEWNALQNDMFKGCELTIICSRDINDRYKDSSKDLHNSYIKDVRSKYWKALFESEKFMGLFTSNLKNEYLNKVKELCDYDFSLYNIYTIKIQLNKHMIKSMEETIMNLFEEFSHKHHYYDETSKNIHMYNGWKHNQAHKIAKKIIIPLSGFVDMQYSWGRYDPANYKVVNKFTDIEKVFNYLQVDDNTEDIDLLETLKTAEHYQETKKIKTKYLSIDFFKKGTAHLTFLDDDLLHRFNIFGSRKKGWLPPSYGKAKYKDMTPEEKAVINEFEGEQSYNKVMSNKDYYIIETSKLLMLAN